MTERDWNAHYAADELPWDTGEPEPHLVELIERRGLSQGPPRRALEVGCGTGTNTLWLAGQGLEVTALDLAPLAIERARGKASQAGEAIAQRCHFMAHDFLADQPPAGPFDLVFDRGCFHVFDERDQQARFAARVASLLAPGGLWLSLIGSTEGPPREFGPPRRSARDVLSAIEPSLALVTLRAIEFVPPAHVDMPRPTAWYCLSQRRAIPAQPSTSNDAH